MKVALLGATRGMGRSLARRMAERGDDLVLLGRDAQELERSVRDLQIRRGDGRLAWAHCDLLDETTFRPALEAAAHALGGLDCVVLTAGTFATQEELERDAELRRRLLQVDFVAAVQFCEIAREVLLAHGGGTLCAFSSVAGVRARKPVVLYGAAKAGLSHYLAGLDLRFRSQGLRVVDVRPGFVRTAMTAGLPEPPFAADPDTIADRVLAAIDRGRPVVFVPPVWRAVMLGIRLLPRFVMRRVRF